ncbi:MAG: type II toxin-antitoxin system RelE/ParE family toxin [Candidatus Omnitrophica bacterium]|nr:type II toxin-antitoxin system RelE/ParE family toxin [Candidatus Omnitrophota bacterium]
MWSLYLPHRVEKELLSTSAAIQDRLQEAIEKLRQDPHPAGSKKLLGKLDCFRIRVGTYRILYDVLSKEKKIVILKIGPRKDVYR